MYLGMVAGAVVGMLAGIIPLLKVTRMGKFQPQFTSGPFTMGNSQPVVGFLGFQTPGHLKPQFDSWTPELSSQAVGYHGGKEGGLVKGKSGVGGRFRGGGDDWADP